jgi:hypothetical protein
MTKTVLLNVSQIQTWAANRDIQFVSGSRDLPYVFKDGLFYYFTKQGNEYHLAMTSIHDLESF